jgi:hypothetical protein
MAVWGAQQVTSSMFLRLTAIELRLAVEFRYRGGLFQHP